MTKKIDMTKKEAKKEIKRINKLPKEEKKFAKSTFLYKYFVMLSRNY